MNKKEVIQQAIVSIANYISKVNIEYDQMQKFKPRIKRFLIEAIKFIQKDIEEIESLEILYHEKKALMSEVDQNVFRINLDAQYLELKKDILKTCENALNTDEIEEIIKVFKTVRLYHLVDKDKILNEKWIDLNELVDKNRSLAKDSIKLEEALKLLEDRLLWN